MDEISPSISLEEPTISRINVNFVTLHEKVMWKHNAKASLKFSEELADNKNLTTEAEARTVTIDEKMENVGKGKNFFNNLWYYITKMGTCNLIMCVIWFCRVSVFCCFTCEVYGKKF
jgi:hypothetical protein